MSTAAPRARGRVPAELRPDWTAAIDDSREQFALNLAPLKAVRGTLVTGDYSVLGLEHHVAIERKSEPDLLACIGVERERFDREAQRLLVYPVRALIVESTWQRIEAGDWHSQVTPVAAMGSLLGWIATGLPVLMVGDHRRPGVYASRLLFTAARRRWRECCGILTTVLETDIALVKHMGAAP